MSASSPRETALVDLAAQAQNTYGLGRRDVLTGVVAATLAAVPIAVLAIGRIYPTYGTETDFLAGFVPEAERILHGGPLRIRYHPPLYPLALAAGHLLGMGWFATGLALSCIAAVSAMLAAYLLFAVQGQRVAAWGALVGLATCPVFIAFGAQATSDLVFLALYLSAITALVLARTSPARGSWTAAGLLVGLTVLTRTNGITLAPVAVATGLWPGASGGRRVSLWGMASFFAVLLVWYTAARATHSPLVPTGNARNLALTYLAPETDRINGDAADLAERRLGALRSSWRSQAGHLARMVIRTYLRDARSAALRLVRRRGLLLFPFGIIAVPGLVLLFRFLTTPMRWLLGSAMLLQAALLNLKAFDARYWLSFTPLLGAGASCILWAAFGWFTNRRLRLTVIAAAALFVGVTTAREMRPIYAELHSADAELGEAIPVAKGTIKAGSARPILMARKPNLPRYSGLEGARIANVRTTEELRAAIAPHKGRDGSGQPRCAPASLLLVRQSGDTMRFTGVEHRPAVYLFVGMAEREFRGELARQLQSGPLPPWITVVARSRAPGAWTLFRVMPPD